MNEKTRYDQVLQKLRRECGMLIQKYSAKLHKASHEDQPDEKLSHMYVVIKMQEDCSRVCTEATHGITFSGDDEEEVIAEILEYNYDERDIEHMIKVEGTNLFSHLQMLNQNCIKRSDPEWSQFDIPQLLQNRKVNPGPVGGKRTQFCKNCGEQIYVSKE
ncbi:MAG: hypothetical protein WBL68_04665 [Nitrososphaeraceae archaeon]